MTDLFEGFYEAPLAAWLRTHGIALDAYWREAVRASNADLRPWKRARVLPRIRAVIGILQSLAPQSLLDVGSGRGAFLWPAHEELSATQFTAVELPGPAAARLAAVVEGGLPRLQTTAADACELPFAADQFEWATALEVLEHLQDPGSAACELRRVTSVGAVITVPRWPDDNPEHLRCFDQAELHRLLQTSGFARVRIEIVEDCWLAIAQHG